VRSAATVISLALAVFLAAPAFAHKRAVRRALMLETAGANTLHVIVAIRIPSGERRRAFDLLADADHDGAYSDQERRAVKKMLAARAIDGLALRTSTAALSLRDVEVKEKIEAGEGPIEVMLHATAPLAGSELAITTSNVGDPLDLLVLSGSRPLVSSSRGKVENGGVKAEMGTGDRVTLRFR
jgi:hypothetical protein